MCDFKSSKKTHAYIFFALCSKFKNIKLNFYSRFQRVYSQGNA